MADWVKFKSTMKIWNMARATTYTVYQETRKQDKTNIYLEVLFIDLFIV